MLAQECSLSSSYFARAFKVTTGLARHQWLTRKRIEHARRLLAQTSMELSEIALAWLRRSKSLFSGVCTPGKAQPRKMAKARALRS
jgi:AraC family transcriptional regulator